MKYQPDFPDRFGCYEDSLSFCRKFFSWYNDEHYHSGIGLVTPSSLHYGQAAQVVASRQAILETAYTKYPERFVHGRPKPPQLPSAVWINPPSKDDAEKKRLPEINCPQKPEEASLTHPRSGYPLADQPAVGARVPAELASVSPNELNNTINPPFEHPSHA